MTADAAQLFEPHRRYLVGLAYRMLGSVAEAEDVVQDSFLRWLAAEHASIDVPRAYLSRVVTRLCLDRLKSARAQREQYVGTWLPEPLVDDGAPTLAEDLSVALLVTLERLSPLERAAFLLHDVFDLDYDEVATTLERSEAACRQLAARAREHVRQGKPRYQPSTDQAARLADAFQAAMTAGDLDALAKLLAADAVFYTDGGGKRTAALNPIYGRDKIVRFVDGVTRKRGAAEGWTMRRVTINGMPGFVLELVDGPETLAIETSGDAIVAIYAVRNPDKLRHLGEHG